LTVNLTEELTHHPEPVGEPLPSEIDQNMDRKMDYTSLSELSHRPGLGMDLKRHRENGSAPLSALAINGGSVFQTAYLYSQSIPEIQNKGVTKDQVQQHLFRDELDFINMRNRNP
jgi:hypothetical protein